MRFVVIADTHTNPADDGELSPFASHRQTNDRLRHAIETVNALQPDFVVHVGDMVHPVPDAERYPDAVAAFRQAVAALQAPLHLVPGNHDSGDKHAAYVPAGVVNARHLALYQSHFGRYFYSFEHDDCLQVVLHTSLINSGLPEEAEQRQWVEDTLAASQHRRRFLFVHYPPFVAEPEEPGHYDNVDEPGRSWLLDLIRRHRLDAVFTGHVHNFFCQQVGDTPVYLMPSTGFVRADYAEVLPAPQPAAHENGRNDTAKLAILCVDVHAERVVPQLLRLYPASGLNETTPTHRQAPQRDWPRLPPAAGWMPLLGLDLRHDWTHVHHIPFSSMLDEFLRKPARNDYPIMALWELGVRHLRVPLQDLQSAASRQRLQLLAHHGCRFRVFVFGVPDAGTRALLQRHRPMLSGVEVILPLPLGAGQGEALAALKRDINLPLTLSRFWNAAADNHQGKQVKLLVDHGFTPDSLDPADPDLTDLIALADSVVFRVSQSMDVAATVSACIDSAERLQKTAQVHVRLADDNPATPRRDEWHNLRRVMQAAMVAATGGSHAVFLDTLNDVDRGYFPRVGLVDNLYNPRRSGNALRTLNGLLSASPPQANPTWRRGEAGDVVSIARAHDALHVFLPADASGAWQLPLPDDITPHARLEAWDLIAGQPAALADCGWPDRTLTGPAGRLLAVLVKNAAPT